MNKTTLQVLNIKDVSPNTWNPNVMRKDIFDYLKKNLSDSEWNYASPILVRTLDEGGYQIIDWEHRWRAMKDEWFEEIIANVCEMDDQEARLKTIWMNKFRSSIDDIKLAELLESLREDYGMTDEDIIKQVWLGEVELEDLDAITSLEAVDETVVDDGIDIADDTTLLKLDFSEEELQEIHDYASILGIDVKSLIMMAVEKSLEHLQIGTEEVVEVKGAVQNFDISGLDF